MKKVPGILLLLITSITYSQDRLTLQDAVSIALKNSLGIKIAKTNVAISNANNSYGMAGGLPSVTFTGSDQEQTSNLNQTLNGGTEIARTGVSNNSATLGVAANMLVYNGGRVVAAKKRLTTVEEQTQQQLSSRGLIVATNVILKYYDIVRQQSFAESLEKNIDFSKQKLDIVKAQQSVGVANNADLFQAQLDLNNQLQALQAQELVIDQGKTDLLAMLTLKTDSTLTIRDSIIIDKSLKLDSVLNNLDYNPDIIAANKQININQYLETEVGAQRYPTLSLGGGLSYARSQSSAGNVMFNQNYGPYVGVNLSLPIYNGSIFKRQEKVATLNTVNAASVRDTLVLNYQATAVKSWQGYLSNMKQLETQQKNYDLAVQLLDLIIKKFQLRQATIVDVRQAQQTFELSAYTLTNISYNAKSSEIVLKRLMNKLTY
ncbi:TolC family protein [Chitinophagaceae bacterium LWZ2-11]